LIDWLLTVLGIEPMPLSFLLGRSSTT
jgi:hypothetical protein